MRRAVTCALAVALLAGVPATALAEGAEKDTQTEALEVAVEGDNTAPASTEATTPATSSAQKTPSTGDGTSALVAACLALAATASAAVAASRKAGAAKKE